MNLPDGLEMISMAEFAAYYDRSKETRATIEKLNLAGGYLSTDKRKEQSVERYPPPPSCYPSC